MKWYIVLMLIVIGLIPLGWSLHDYMARDKELSTAHAIMILAGLVCILIAVLQPESLKLGDVELKNITQRAENAAESANLSAQQAKANAKLAIEANAMSIWNRGRLGAIGSAAEQEKLATEVLKQAYGDKADKVKSFMQHEGLFMTPEDELKNVPNVKLDKDELPEMYRLKENSGAK